MAALRAGRKPATLPSVRFLFSHATRDADATPERNRIGCQPRRNPGEIARSPTAAPVAAGCRAHHHLRRRNGMLGDSRHSVALKILKKSSHNPRNGPKTAHQWLSLIA